MADALDPVVTTPAGDVRGSWRRAGRSRSAAFLGVPFAEAPIGPLRFAAPQPRRPWSGVRDARRPGPTAQRVPLAPVTTIPEPSTPGEDVLNLNVFTPAPRDRGARLPVLVWIHGGGYIGGCQNSPWYDGAGFNRDGVVTVSIGYRLGIDGWLPLEGAPPNRGALDWVAALQWVRDAIAEFGGDPQRVTVAGQSAGGGAVLTLLGMPSAAGLFARAVSLSGAVGRSFDVEHARRTARQFTELTGRPATADAARDLGDEETQTVTEALSGGPDGLPTVNLTPMADGEVVPNGVLEAVTRGASADLPLLLGFARHEFNDVAAQIDPGLPGEVAVAMLAGLGMDGPVAARLVADRADQVPDVLGQALTDATFRRLGVAVAEQRAAAIGPVDCGRRLHVAVPVRLAVPGPRAAGSGLPLPRPAVLVGLPGRRAGPGRYRGRPAPGPGRRDARGPGPVRIWRRAGLAGIRPRPPRDPAVGRRGRGR